MNLSTRVNAGAIVAIVIATLAVTGNTSADERQPAPTVLGGQLRAEQLVVGPGAARHELP